MVPVHAPLSDLLPQERKHKQDSFPILNPRSMSPMDVLDLMSPRDPSCTVSPKKGHATFSFKQLCLAVDPAERSRAISVWLLCPFSSVHGNTHRPLFQPPVLFLSPPAGYCKQGKGKLGVFPLPKHVGSSTRPQHHRPQPPRLLFGYHSHVPLTWGKVKFEPLLPLLLIKTLEEILSWSKYSLLLALAHWFLKAPRSSHIYAVNTDLGSHFCGQINKYHCIPFSSVNATLRMACVLT